MRSHRLALLLALTGALTVERVAPVGAQDTLVWATTNLNLRADSAPGAPVLATIPRGASAKLDACSGAWCQVTYLEATGYAAAQYLTTTRPSIDATGCVNAGWRYVNSGGQWVPSPCRAAGPPTGATAQCRDGTCSFSQSRRGTCSHHGGVATWLRGEEEGEGLAWARESHRAGRMRWVSSSIAYFARFRRPDV